MGGLLYDVIDPAAPFYLNGAILMGATLWVILMLRQKQGNKAEQGHKHRE